MIVLRVQQRFVQAFHSPLPRLHQKQEVLCPEFSSDATEELFDALPDCTVKSAWVTLDAHSDPERRVDLQIALANLGLDVLFSPDETLKGEPHWTTAQEIEEIMNVSAANRAACLAAPPLQSQPAVATIINEYAEDSE